MSYYLKPDSLITEKFNVVLDLTNYDTEKEVEHATDVDTSDLAVKKTLLL